MADELGRPCLVPLAATIRGCADPAGVFFSIRRRGPPSYLLESAEGPQQVARYSVIGQGALLHLQVEGEEPKLSGRPDLVEAARERVGKAEGTDALAVLREAMFFKDVKVPEVISRYLLGAVGYISYDFVRSMVDIGSKAIDDLKHPQLEFVLPECTIVFDHLRNETHYCSPLLLTASSDTRDACARAVERLKELVTVKKITPSGPQPKVTASSNLTKAEFERAVETAQGYIRAGDILQVVLSRRIELRPAPKLEQFYSSLRRMNPSPYMFFLDLLGRSVVGSSPEILVRVAGREVVTRPIGGTRRRGRDEEEDKKIERELLTDEKERKEHMMLLCLAREDLSKVARAGSVKIEDFMTTERYSHVMHLVSTVRGVLRDDRDGFDALRTNFPAGTVVGAPRLRAMEIIEELEPVRRGIYAGGVGSLSYTGDVDFAIAIRTLIAEGGRGYVQAGAGIVADSVPWKEYLETENKSKALLHAAGIGA